MRRRVFNLLHLGGEPRDIGVEHEGVGVVLRGPALEAFVGQTDDVLHAVFVEEVEEFNLRHAKECKVNAFAVRFWQVASGHAPKAAEGDGATADFNLSHVVEDVFDGNHQVFNAADGSVVRGGFEDAVSVREFFASLADAMGNGGVHQAHHVVNVFPGISH